MSQINIISVINQKGGVAKTTTAHALGMKLSALGLRVLFVDLDPQANLSTSMGADITGLTVIDVLKQDKTGIQAIQQTSQGEIIPSGPSAAGADLILNVTGKEYLLREALEPLHSNYDFIIIDTPPALGTLTINALTASTGVIIPAQADDFSLQGIGQLYNSINIVRKYTNPKLEIIGMLLTRHNSRTVLGREIEQSLARAAFNLGTKLFNTKIRENIAVKEAQYSQQSIYDYAPESNAALDYAEFATEVLETLNMQAVKG